MMVIFESQFMYSQQIADDVMKAENVTTSDNVFSKVFVDLFHKQTLQALNFEKNVDQTVWYKRWSQWIDWATYKALATLAEILNKGRRGSRLAG